MCVSVCVCVTVCVSVCVFDCVWLCVLPGNDLQQGALVWCRGFVSLGPAAAPAPASQQVRLRSRQLVVATLLEVRGWIAPLSKLVLEYRGAGHYDSKAQTLTGHSSTVLAVGVVDAQG